MAIRSFFALPCIRKKLPVAGVVGILQNILKMCSFSGILQRFCNASFGTILLYLKKEEESGMPEQNIPMNMQQRKK